MLNAWGAGKYDPRFNIDGLSKPTVIPPAYGLEGVHKVTYTGDGTELAYWNRYVAVTQMGGSGSFTEPRLGLSITNGSVDLVTSKLPALQAYQLSIAAPRSTGGQLRPGRRGTRAAGVRRPRRLRHLPQRRALHRCEQHAASAGGLHGRARVAELRVAFGDQALSHRRR